MCTVVDIKLDTDQLVVKHTPTLKYTLQELLAQCDNTAPIAEEDELWMSSSVTGKELL